eukprot:TRINITY_DN18729_c0_g1_i1.p1 TRINITY_DN18729_c0_g1~~TRINITY_DN18729_c0_g1_i1.p1  ORF type:complete len:218 (-),score=65.34 TRINITY_DN18729_c0_g1_i1:9-662(-)
MFCPLCGQPLPASSVPVPLPPVLPLSVVDYALVHVTPTRACVEVGCTVQGTELHMRQRGTGGTAGVGVLEYELKLFVFPVPAVHEGCIPRTEQPTACEAALLRADEFCTLRRQPRVYCARNQTSVYRGHISFLTPTLTEAKDRCFAVGRTGTHVGFYLALLLYYNGARIAPSAVAKNTGALPAKNTCEDAKAVFDEWALAVPADLAAFTFVPRDPTR